MAITLNSLAKGTTGAKVYRSKRGTTMTIQFEIPNTDENYEAAKAALAEVGLEPNLAKEDGIKDSYANIWFQTTRASINLDLR